MRNLLTLIILSFSSIVLSQDVHFSMMKFSPLTVNPSLAGLNGKLNASANYRSQWNSVADPYTTFGASFDVRLLDNKVNNKGFLALGLNFFHDIAGDLKMTTSNVNLSVAYHIKMNDVNTIGLGIQTGYASRGLNRMNGTFASQYNGFGFDMSIPNGENFRETNFGFFDTGAGIVYNHNSFKDFTTSSSNGFNLSVGIGAYHLTKPKYSYLQNGDDDLKMKLIGFVEADLMLGNSDFGLMPAIYYQRQGKFQEIYLGTYIKYNVITSSRITDFKDNLYIAYGAFYRFKDAFVNKLLIDYKGYALGFAYDINVSSLTQASKGRGGFEILFRYTLSELYNRTRIR